MNRLLAVLLTLGLGLTVGCGRSGDGSRAGATAAGNTDDSGGSDGGGDTASTGDPDGSTQDSGISGDGQGLSGAQACATGITGPVSGMIGTANNCWGPGSVTTTADVDVPAGVTLTINPGTTVSGVALINVTGGTFQCVGTYDSPVKFFGNWIQLNGGSHAITYCILNSQGATAVDVNGAQVAISHLQIQRYNTYGVHVRGASARVSIDFGTIGTTTTLFSGNDLTHEATAVAFDAIAASGASSITNSVLGFLHDASNTGLKEMGATSNLHLAYDYVSGTQTTIVTTDRTGVFQGVPGIADIPNLDHNLDFFAPALDLADPKIDYAQEPIPNGGRANLGYHGGTSGARVTSVQITFPNGCESFPAGSTQTVTWHSSPNTGSKTLEFSPDNGKTWMHVAAVAAGMDFGSTSVTFPNVATDQALLRFSQDNDPTHIFSVSNHVFALGMAKNQAACTVPIRCPSGTTTCKYFKAICYEGYRDGQSPTVVEPTCDQVAQDLKILAPYTHGIRTYGSNPLLHDGKCIPALADMLGLDLHMGVWVDNTYSDMQNVQAIDDALSIIGAGHPSIKTLIVGNEYLLRVRQSFGDTVAAEKRLVNYITYARTKAPRNIEVVTTESYPDWLTASPALYNAVDRIIWHVHPWWQQVPIASAAAHVATTHGQMLAKMKALGINKSERLGETGYPWAIGNGAAQGSEANEAQYLKDLNAYSASTGLEYWFFEAFDENWKSAEGPAGGKWGMWPADRAAAPHPIISGIAMLIRPEDQWP